MDLNELLTPEERELYRRLMETVGARGDVAVSAHDSARRMLHALATSEGKGNTASGVHIGRDTILPLLVDALVGPDPDPEAWLAAIAAGSFDLSLGKTYARPAAPGNRNDQTALGSPGTYLPRLLKRYERAQSKTSRRGQSDAAELRNALGLLIATALFRELKNATNARTALGSAWPLTHAIMGRPRAELRRRLMHFSADDQFIAHLSTAIEGAVAEWVKLHGPDTGALTNKQVDENVAAGIDVTAVFMRQTEADKRREDALVAFGKLMLENADAQDEVSARALSQLAAEPAFADWRDITSTATPPLARYLDEPVELIEDELDRHYRHLRLLMPIAAGPSNPSQIEGCALGVARLVLPDFEVEVTGVRAADRIANTIARKIFNYAWKVGPPTPAVALEHLHWFEASVCYYALSANWPARKAWSDIGLMPCPANSKALDRVNARLATMGPFATVPIHFELIGNN